MPTVTFVDNPHSPGAKMEMERLRAENAALKRRLGDGGSVTTEAAPLTEQQLAEQPRTFESGNCRITIVPLSQLPPLRMNPDFGNITIRGQEETGQARVGKKKATPQIAEKSQSVKKAQPAPSYAEEEDESAQRFALLELDLDE